MIAAPIRAAREVRTTLLDHAAALAPLRERAVQRDRRAGVELVETEQAVAEQIGAVEDILLWETAR